MIYFITGNKNKFIELKNILGDIKHLDINLPEIQEIDLKVIIKAKLIEASNHHDGDFIVEDTGLYLDCLNGLPGPMIKWFLDELGNDGLINLTQKLGNNRVKVKTVIGYSKSPQEIYYFEGSVKGKIIQPEGDKGFGWDPIFLFDRFNKTYAQVDEDERKKIGMQKPREIALEKLKDFLKNEN